ncbi:retrovirus-related pol polyprotein from transposon TNT 1-94 [Tanacetum coccineum]
MPDIFVSMEKEFHETLRKNQNFNNDLDRLFEATLVHDIMSLVMHSSEEIENENLRAEIDKMSNESSGVQEKLLKEVAKLESNFQRCQAQSIAFEIELQYKEESSVSQYSWTSKLEQLDDENVSLEFQVESLVIQLCVRFGNDHLAVIMSFGDYVYDNIKICHVYYVEGLEHNLFSIGQYVTGNHTLVEAARTMLIFLKLADFLWAATVATACFTQNFSLIHSYYNKTPYELVRGKKPDLKHFHVFGSLCYSTNDRDDLGKLKPKADIGIFIGYSEKSKGFRIYNRRTRKIMETIHVRFDELTAMAS